MRWVCALVLVSCTERAGPADAFRGDGASADGGAITDRGVSLDVGGSDATADASTSDGGADAGTPDAGPSCTFASALDPRDGLAPADLDRLAECIAARPGDADALRAEFLNAAARGTFWDDGDVLVFSSGPTAATISGSFDGWPDPGIRSFSAHPGSGLWIAHLPVGRTERHQYKLTEGGVWSTHADNGWVVWDGFDQGGVGDFNNEVFGPDHALTTSVIHRRFVDDRWVYLQLPIAVVDDVSTPVGVLYISDGNEMLTRAGMQSVVDQTVAAARAAPTAVVWVALPNQNVRFDEYTYGTASARGDAYVAYLADAVVPAIEADLVTTVMPQSRGIGGASLGGLIALHAAFLRPDVFRRIGAQSASLFWENEEMTGRVLQTPAQPFTIYLDSGSPNDNMVVTQNLADALDSVGYDHLHVIEPNGRHEWPFWAGRFDELLAFLYP